MLKIYLHKTHKDAVIPEIAYNGTSAAFDITATENTLIPAGKYAIVPNGLNLTINEKDPYYMAVALRSSMGFKKNLICHPGIIDAGYTGDLGVKIYNLGTEDILIEKGQKYAQITVHQKNSFKFVELNDEEFDKFKASQLRADSGFGSSGK